MNKKVLVFLAVASFLAGACAKSQTSATGEEAREYIQLWMEKYHPGISANSDGLYILSETEGTGEEWNNQKAYVLVHSTIYSLDGTISSTTDSLLYKQLGTFVRGNYYGPRYQTVGSGYSYAGMDALLKGMKIGGRRKAVIPAWMLTTSRYNTQAEYIKNCTLTSHLIYEITLEGQTDDPEKDAADFLANYVHQNYGYDIQSVSYITDEEPDGTFWFISDISGFNEDDKLSETASIEINYTGKLAKNGTIFDTTVRKVAKDNRIYDDTRSYVPLSATMAASYSEITVDQSSSYINGFKGGLHLMHWKGQKAVVLFTSKHGYSSSGSGNAIPGYAPLIFEIEILK